MRGRSLFMLPGVHLAVVDPGSARNAGAIAIRAGDRILVGPDNGLLVPAAGTIHEVVENRDSPYRLEAVSIRSTAATSSPPSPPTWALGEPLHRNAGEKTSSSWSR